MKKRGQSSVELIIILSAALVVLSIIIGINQNALTNFSSQSRNIRARSALDDIANAAELVYQQGQGAKTRVYVNLPGQISSSSASGKTLQFILTNGNKVLRNLDVNVTGILPTTEGPQWVTIESGENYVIIGSEVGEAGCLSITVNGATWSNNNKDIGNIILLNNCDYNITVKQARLSWTAGGGSGIEKVDIDGVRWDKTGANCNGCSPSDFQGSGTWLDFGGSDLILLPQINYPTISDTYRFQLGINSGTPVTFEYKMFDDTTKLSSNITAP